MRTIKMSFEGVLKMSEEMKRLNIVISADLHRSLKVSAALNGITLQQFVAEAIAEKIQRQKGDND